MTFQCGMVMLWVMLLVALWLKSGSVVSVCIPNAFINTLDVLYPAENNLVHNPYYTKLSAEIVVDAAEFTKKQQEFHICAIATMDVGNERVEIYKECGRSVFGQGAVYGKDGVNYLQLSLHHNNTKLCEVNITVHCCADVVSAGAVLEAKKQATLDSFLRTGSDFKRRNQEKETESHTSKNVSIGDRFVFSERSPLNVVIGIKSSAMYNAKRESIRSSWFKQAQLASQNPINIVPFFLIGNSTNAHKNETIASLLQHEQQLYRDMLLANDLPVSDSYLTLGQKVLYFMKWVFTHSHGARIDYVIMCDDDVYIDVWLLNEFLSALQHSQTGEYFYGGEVLEYRMHEVYHPIRDIQHRNYLGSEHYPLSVLPPFALGNFYILGSALWKYLALNADTLRPTGTLEDLSVAVWMMGLQVFPQHLSGVCDISRCLYDSSIYNATAAETLTGAAGIVAAAPQRLLAVADLQDSTEFALLDQVVSYRESHQWGNNQDALSLMKSAVTHLSYRSTQRNFAWSPPATPAPARYVEVADIQEVDFLNHRTIFHCSSCSGVKNSMYASAPGRPLRLALFVPNMWYTEENVCVLEAIRCDLSQNHVIEVVTNTIVADGDILELMRKTGVAVRYFEELSTENHKATTETSNKAHRLLDYLASFDVLVHVIGAAPSEEEQEVRHTLQVIQEKLRLRASESHGESRHTLASVLIAFDASIAAAFKMNHDGVVEWDIAAGRWRSSTRKLSTMANCLDENMGFIIRTVAPSSTAQLLGGDHVLALPASPAAPAAPLSTVYLDEINIILGAQSHYAAGILDRFLNLAYPSYRVINRYSLQAAKDGSDAHIYKVNRDFVFVVELSDGDMQSFQVQKSVLFLSVLDCTELDMSQAEAVKQLQWTEHSQRCLDAAVRVTNATSVVFLSGEPLDLSTMRADRIDLLLSTTTEKHLLPLNAPVHYLPVHAASFFEMNRVPATATVVLSSLDLLSNSQQRTLTHCTVDTTSSCTGNEVQAKSRGVAYLYHRCDRHQREEFFRILHAKLESAAPELTVEALGRCSGGHRSVLNAPSRTPVSSRFDTNYLDQAVDIYRAFKFVIAFENSRVRGYITEKLTTAYLSGAVPVYFGAPDVSDYFNPHSMINCGDYASLVDCANRVLEVHRDLSLYEEMVRAAPIANLGTWATLFPWERKAALFTQGKLFQMLLKKAFQKLTL